MLSNAQQQPWGIVPVPDPVDSPLCLVDRHFIEPIPGVGESTQATLVLYVMPAKRHVRCWFGGQLQTQKVHLLLVFNM